MQHKSVCTASDVIGADSTGAAGKLPRYPRNNRGKSIILPRYYFAPNL